MKSHSEGNSTFKIDTWIDNSEFKALPTLLSTKEKWETYLNECSDKEITEIAVMSNFISNKINKRRNTETNQKMKEENDLIYQYYKKQGVVD